MRNNMASITKMVFYLTVFIYQGIFKANLAPHKHILFERCSFHVILHRTDRESNQFDLLVQVCFKSV